MKLHGLTPVVSSPPLKFENERGIGRRWSVERNPAEAEDPAQGGVFGEGG